MGRPEGARLWASVCTLQSFCANGPRGQRLLPGQLLSGLDQGSKPCLLHWQADSLPLSHQGSAWRTSPIPPPPECSQRHCLLYRPVSCSSSYAHTSLPARLDRGIHTALSCFSEGEPHPPTPSPEGLETS